MGGLQVFDLLLGLLLADSVWLPKVKTWGESKTSLQEAWPRESREQGLCPTLGLAPVLLLAFPLFHES